MARTSSALALVFAFSSIPFVASPASALPGPDAPHAPTVSATAARHEVGRADDPYFDAVTEQGRRARGLYFPGHWVAQNGAAAVIRTLREAGLDAAVIDVKNDNGVVLIDTQVPELSRVRVPVLRDAAAIIRELHENGIYVIARMVCFKGSRLAAARPDHAVADVRPERRGKVWRSNSGDAWLDPSDPANHTMLRDLAVEVQALGFDELQLDYIRYPVDADTAHARFRHLRRDTPRWQPIHAMLRAMDAALHIPLSIDIFGVAALGSRDTDRLGQNVEHLSEHVEVISPMLYANNFKSWRPARGEDRGESFIRAAMTSVRERAGDAMVIRPYLQAFPMGASRTYGDRMIAGQIDAARSRRGDGFLFWNPGASYGAVVRGMRLPGARDAFDWRTRR